MYIVTVKANGHQYVRLVEARRENGRKKVRVIKAFGRLDALLEKDPNALETLRKTYCSEEQRAQSAAAVRLQKASESLAGLRVDDGATWKESLPLLRYGHYALKTIWEEIGLKTQFRNLQRTNAAGQVDLNSLISYLTFKKVMSSCSLLASFQAQDQFLGNPVAGIPLDAYYEALDFVDEHKEAIFRCTNRFLDRQFGRERTALVFYDVTNAYFETPLTDAERNLESKEFPVILQNAATEAREAGTLDDEFFDADGNVIADLLPQTFIDALADERFLRMRGASKEHRTDLPIVSIALVIDRYANPIDVRVYAGNAAEKTAMKASVAELKNKYGFENAIVVADRGLNSVENLLMLRELGLGYVVAQSVSRFNEDLRAKMLDMSKYETLKDSEEETIRYRVLENWEKTGSGGRKINCCLVLTHSKRREARDKAVLDAWKKLVERKAAKKDKVKPRSSWAALAKTTGKTEATILGVDEEEYKKRLALCGFAAMVYDDAPPSEDAEANVTSEGRNRALRGEEVISQYRCLGQIEECFRIMKSNLGLRPMYVWTSAHIRAHITICVLALLLIRLLQQKLKSKGHALSINEICRALNEEVLGLIPTENNDCLFGRFGWGPNLRKGRERQTDEELGSLLVSEDAPTRHHLANIFEACGLRLPPRLCSRNELAKCLRTRFPKLTDAVPTLRLVAAGVDFVTTSE